MLNSALNKYKLWSQNAERHKMKYTKIVADDQGHSHFQDMVVELKDHGDPGFLSEAVEVSSLQFRQNKEDYYWDFHPAPSKQFFVLLDGEIEIETSLGEKRRFKGGDILLVEDIAGAGHRTRNITRQIRNSLFIKLK